MKHIWRGEPSTADQHKQQQPKAAVAATKESASRLPHSLFNTVATTVAAHSPTKQYYCFGNTNGQRALTHADIASLSPLWVVHRTPPHSCASGPSPAVYTTYKRSTDASTNVKHKCIHISESSSSVITQGFTMQPLPSPVWRRLALAPSKKRKTSNLLEITNYMQRLVNFFSLFFFAWNSK